MTEKKANKNRHFLKHYWALLVLILGTLCFAGELAIYLLLAHYYGFSWQVGGLAQSLAFHDDSHVWLVVLNIIATTISTVLLVLFYRRRSKQRKVKLTGKEVLQLIWLIAVDAGSMCMVPDMRIVTWNIILIFLVMFLAEWLSVRGETDEQKADYIKEHMTKEGQVKLYVRKKKQKQKPNGRQKQSNPQDKRPAGNKSKRNA